MSSVNCNDIISIRSIRFLPSFREHRNFLITSQIARGGRDREEDREREKGKGKEGEGGNEVEVEGATAYFILR